MLNIQHIDHLVLRVRALQPMLDFYLDVLGCRMERERPDIGLYQLRAGSSLIDLVPVDGQLGRQGGAAPGEGGRNLDHLCLRVEPFDAEAIAAHLQAHGLPGGEPASRYGAEGEGPSIYVSDPEGNVIELEGSAMAIELSREVREQAIRSIERWFETERDERIGNLAAGALLGFFLEEIAPSVYNQAVAEAQERLQARVAELDIEIHEDEFGYWQRRTQVPRNKR